MLRSLLTEIVRRRLWPIPLIAVAVAIGAPLLFLKSSPVNAPSATAPAPAVAAERDLPARAEQLLATSDASAAGKRRRPANASHDPFAPPAGGRTKGKKKAVAAAAAKDPSTSESAEPKPVAVVVTNADGSVPTTGTTPAPATGSADIVPSLPKAGSTAADGRFGGSTAVDVRFGEHIDSKLRRAISPAQTFIAGGTIVAVFVKYSPEHDTAVFAISPRTIVSGDVECRHEAGLCRYVEIPPGSHARLTMPADDGSLVTRRLDVVRVKPR